MFDWLIDSDAYNVYRDMHLTGVGIASARSIGINTDNAIRITSPGKHRITLIARVWARHHSNLLICYCTCEDNNDLFWFPIWRGTDQFNRIRSINIGEKLTIHLKPSKSSVPYVNFIER